MTKPGEPYGLGAIVQDTGGQVWVRKSLTITECWTTQIGHAFCTQSWNNLPATVKIVSLGVHPSQLRSGLYPVRFRSVDEIEEFLATDESAGQSPQGSE